MENKAKLPKKVAESIETLRSHDYKVSNHDILFIFAESYNNGYPDLVKFAQNHFDTLLQALVNGYEIEETPESKVKSYYDVLAKRVNHHEIDESRAERRGMKFVLNAFNIKIEGVNDHE